MADDTAEYTGGKPARQAVPNTLKWLWNKTIYDSMRYYRTKKSSLIPSKSFLISFLIPLLQAKISRLKDMESEEKEFGRVDNKILPKVKEVYEKLSGYINPELIKTEIGYIKDGTGLVMKPVRIGTHNYQIPIPDKKPLHFPDGSVQYAYWYGRDAGRSLFDNNIGPTITQMKDDALRDIDNMPGISDAQKEARKKVIIQFEKLTRPFLKSYMEGDKYNEMFARQYGILRNFESHWHKYGPLWNELMNHRPQEVVYFHTYHRVIGKNKAGQSLHTATHPAPGFTKRPNEVDWGLDDRGMPLEVVPAGGHKFVDPFRRVHNLQEGDILMDAFLKYRTETPGAFAIRRVDPSFIGQVDLIEATAYIHCEWDNYRDDYRDGRWHPKSLTVTDYIMAASPSIGGEWQRKRFPNKIGPEYAHYTMEINGGSFKNVRRATDLNPAFDLRVLKKNQKGQYTGVTQEHRYIGSIRYYAPNEVATEDQLDFALTTRGISLFIIEEISRKGKNLAEIREELISIGKKIAGYDYGPRPFGDPEFTIDHFAIDYARVNEKRTARENKLA